MKPPIRHKRLDRCQSCQDRYHKRDLVYAMVEWTEPIGSNYFLYNRYNSNFWICDTATDAGEISQKVEKELSTIMGHPVEVSLVEDIPLEGSGKVRWVKL